MKQARMAKVLGCLVGAMTFGAAGLMWIEPYTTHLYPDAAVNGGGSYMLRAQPAADRSHWRGVLIEHSVPDSVVAGGGSLAESGYHFIVDTDGTREVSRLWGAQQDAPSRRGLICIGVQGYPRSADLSIQQWESLLSLLRAIQDRYRIDGPHIQLRCHPSTATPVLKQQTAQLAAMLRAAGVR